MPDIYDNTPYDMDISFKSVGGTGSASTLYMSDEEMEEMKEKEKNPIGFMVTDD